eukprot:scaffold489_cov259-Pinguiococcus_pyrenoidosus.AAC.32
MLLHRRQRRADASAVTGQLALGSPGGRGTVETVIERGSRPDFRLSRSTRGPSSSGDAGRRRKHFACDLRSAPGEHG